VRVHLAVKHPFQLETTHFRFETLRIRVDVASSRLVVLTLGKLEELSGVRYALRGLLDLFRLGGQTSALTAQLLCPFGFIPNGRVFQLARYLFEALLFEIVLKETPVRSRFAPLGL
jgi:hypothetical protein